MNATPSITVLFDLVKVDLFNLIQPLFTPKGLKSSFIWLSKLIHIHSRLYLLMIHSLHPDLLTCSNLTLSTCISPCSHMRVLYPAMNMIPFHIKRDFMPTKEIYGPPHPFIHLTKCQEKINIPISCMLI